MYSKLIGLLIAASAFSVAAFAAYLPQDCALNVAGRCFTRSEAQSLIVLVGTVPTSGVITTLRKLNGTAGYQTTGSGFMIDAIVCINQGTAGKCAPAYSDDDVGYNAGAATNLVYIASNGSSEYGQAKEVVTGVIDGSTAIFGAYAFPPLQGWTVPTGKYVDLLAGAAVATSVKIYGHVIP